MFGRDLQGDVDQLLEQLPIWALKEIVRTKLEALGVSSDEEVLTLEVEAILSWEETDCFEGCVDGRAYSIHINELQNILTRLEDAVRDFPEKIVEEARSEATAFYKEAIASWKASRSENLEIEAAFKCEINRTWGDAIDTLEMMCFGLLEAVTHRQTEVLESRDKFSPTKQHALIRLIARGCCVGREVVDLLKAGFSDGAMARWRTMHEVAVVAEFIAANDEELAARFLMHSVVEEWVASKALISTLRESADAQLHAEANERRTRVDEACARFGSVFKEPYGWAAEIIGNPNPKFSDIEKAVGLAQKRWQYKLASFGVHAGVSGLLYGVGPQNHEGRTLAGPTTLGLEIPGANASSTLAMLANCLREDKPSIDFLVGLMFFADLDRDCQAKFSSAAQNASDRIKQ